jgi:cyanophycinase
VTAQHGPVALVGSGEYLPSMLEIEAALLDGRPPRYVQLPTAAAPEGEKSVRYWTDLGLAQAARLGVTGVPLHVETRADADDPALAEQVNGAGLIYLSGGKPSYLAATLRGTAVLTAIVNAWRSGAAVAGCSAGAMALGDRVPDFRRPLAEPTAGLGLVPRLRVIPHFDRFGSWMTKVPRRLWMGDRADAVIVGIDEDTALVSDDGDLTRWTVRGRQSVWVLHAGGHRTQYAAGDQLELE